MNYLYKFVPTNKQVMKIEEIIKTNKTLLLERKTLINLVYTSTILSTRLSEVLKKYDISTEQFNVLRILRGQNGKPANMSCIQERMIAKTSNTTRLVDKLLTKELVIRNICELNKRKMEVSITNKGLELLENLDPTIEELEISIFKNIEKKELEQLNTILDKIRNE